MELLSEAEVFSSIDDAIRILLWLGKGALMARVDLKSAFQMVPVHPADWELLVCTGRRVSTLIPVSLWTSFSPIPVQ